MITVDDIEKAIAKLDQLAKKARRNTLRYCASRALY